MLKKAKKVCTFLFWLGAGWLTVLPLLWRVAGERQWFLLLCQYAPPCLYLLALLMVALLAALCRPRRAWLGLLAPLLWLVMLLLPFHFQRGRAGEFSAMSWNIQAGLSGPDKIADLLKEQGADVVCLQEARVPSAQPGGLDPVPVILTKWPRQVARGGERGELVVLTRFTMITQRLHPLGGLSQALEVLVERNGKPMRILNVHLMTGDPQGKLRGQPTWSSRRVTLSAETRRIQADSLLRVVQSSDAPTLLMGDFNSPPTSVAYSTLQQGLTDAFAASGWGWGLTYPANHPFWRIDYVWCKNLTPVQTQVLHLPASDHRALICQLEGK